MLTQQAVLPQETAKHAHQVNTKQGRVLMDASTAWQEHTASPPDRLQVMTASDASPADTPKTQETPPNQRALHVALEK